LAVAATGRRIDDFRLGLGEGARKNTREQNLPKNIAEIAEIAETAAAQRLLAPVSSSREGGDSGYSNLPVTKLAGHIFQSDCPGH
jgi:hypothetical protein